MSESPCNSCQLVGVTTAIMASFETEIEHVFCIKYTWQEDSVLPSIGDAASRTLSEPHNVGFYSCDFSKNGQNPDFIPALLDLISCSIESYWTRVECEQARAFMIVQVMQDFLCFYRVSPNLLILLWVSALALLPRPRGIGYSSTTRLPIRTHYITMH